MNVIAEIDIHSGGAHMLLAAGPKVLKGFVTTDRQFRPEWAGSWAGLPHADRFEGKLLPTLAAAGQMAFDLRLAEVTAVDQRIVDAMESMFGRWSMLASQGFAKEMAGIEVQWRPIHLFGRWAANVGVQSGSRTVHDFLTMTEMSAVWFDHAMEGLT